MDPKMARHVECVNTPYVEPGSQSSIATTDSIIASTRNQAGLRSAVRDTVQRLLRHTAMSMLLMLRLYALCLLFILRKLRLPDPLYHCSSTIWFDLQRSLQDQTRPLLDAMIYQWLLRKLHKAIRICTTPIRLTRNLYRIANVMDHHPDFFTVQDDKHTMWESPAQSPNSSSTNIGDPRNPQLAVSAPASASQIYHAALVNNGTLDNLLAAFSSPLVDAGLINCNLKQDGKEFMLGDSMEISYKWRGPKTQVDTKAAYNNAKVDNKGTAEYAAQRVEMPSVTLPNESVNDEHADVAVQHSLILPKDIEEQRRQVDTAGFLQNVQVVADADEVQLNQCPTFARRHGQSKLPVRTAIGPNKGGISVLTDIEASVPNWRGPKGTHKNLQRRRRQ